MLDCMHAWIQRNAFIYLYFSIGIFGKVFNFSIFLDGFNDIHLINPMNSKTTSKMFLFFDALNEQAITNCCVRFIRIHTIVYRNFTWFSCVRDWQWQLQFVSAPLSSPQLCHDSDLVSYTHSPHTHSIHSEVKFKCLNWNTANNVLIGIFCCGIQVYWGNFGIFFKGFGHHNSISSG